MTLPLSLARWGRKDAPPAIGDLITVGRYGAAVVTGYFIEDGCLGVRSTLLAPSADWFKSRKPGSEHNVCTFGPEFEPCEPPATPQAVTLTWRDEVGGPAFRVYDAPWASPGPEHRVFVKALKAGGFQYDASRACWTISVYRQGLANAFALAARLRHAGFAVTHAGCYGEAGPASDGLKPWWPL